MAATYFLVRALHLTLFWLISRDDPQLRRQVLWWVPSVLAGPVVLLVAVLPALLTLAVLAVVLSALIAWETIRYAEVRGQIRRDHAHGH